MALSANQTEKGDYDVTVTRDDRSVQNQGRRKTFRFQIQGPNAMAILEKVVDGPMPTAKLFNIAELSIAGRAINALLLVVGSFMDMTPAVLIFTPLFCRW